MHGIDQTAVAAVMPLPVALAPEAERLVQLDRRLVVREVVQLQLRDTHAARPVDGSLQQRAADPLPPVALRDHQPEIRDMRARRVGIPSDGEAADDPARRLGDEDGGIAGAAQRSEIPALVPRPAPLACRDQPALGLRTDLARQLDERGRVARFRLSDREFAHSMTKPWPPRRASPAAASEPSSRNSTPAAPPKYRFRRRQRTSG